MTELRQAEYQRLSEEIQRDRDLQFTVFWQSLAVTALLLSVFAGTLSLIAWSRIPFVVLAPHIILIPACAIILNRARTANRKSGYVIVAFTSHNDNNTNSRMRNWEHDLSVFRSKENSQDNDTPPHRATTILHMLISATVMEILCLVAFIALMIFPDDTDSLTSSIGELMLAWIYLLFYSYMLSARTKAYFCTRYADSIQGYAKRWQVSLGVDKSILDHIIIWDAESWKTCLLDELRNHHFLSMILKPTPRKDGFIDVKKRPLKAFLIATLFSVILIDVIYNFIHAERIGSLHFGVVTLLAIISVVFMVYHYWERKKYTVENLFKNLRPD